MKYFLSFILLLSHVVSISLAEGTLSAFEERANRGRETKPVNQTGYRADKGPRDGSIFGSIAGELLSQVFVTGGLNSLERLDEFAPGGREAGDPLIPFTRLDLTWQNVESDVEAIDVFGECGYGPAALQLQHTRFRETSPDADLGMTRVVGLYRMTFGERLEWDIGGGILTLSGDEANTRAWITSPVLIHPTNHLGLEYRPGWGSGISSHDLSMLLHHDFLSLKVGYRWLAAADVSLNGPYLGATIRF